MGADVTKHWFLQPSMTDPRYVCGGWQIFNRARDLASRLRETELLTYRHREEGWRYLDDVPAVELAEGIVWVYWGAHVRELAERLQEHRQVVLYAMNDDYGRWHGQATPARWPVVALSRFLAAQFALREPSRLIHYLGPVLHPEAVNRGGERDLDIAVHVRKTTPYLRHELVPALAERLQVEVLRTWTSQEDFLRLLNRTRVYLYWVHLPIPGIRVYEGFGMQPLEAAACGAIPVANAYGGLSDYLEAPYNCRKIGVHSLDYDVLQVERAVREHQGANADEERLQATYSEEAFLRRFEAIEADLTFYFEHCPQRPMQRFALEPPGPPLHRRPYEWLYRWSRRSWRELRGIRPL
jgi:hypothetical protein